MQNAILASNIKQVCKEKGISLNTLIQECNLSKSFIYDLEKRNTSPSCDKVLRIAKYLNVTMDYLLEFAVDTEDIKRARVFVKSWLETTTMSIAEIEKAIGTNYATLKTWCCGIGNYFNERLSILADLIDCSVDYLLGRTDVVEVNKKSATFADYLDVAAEGGKTTRPAKITEIETT